MSLFKKIIAASAALAMAVSFASCGKDTSWGAEIDGTQLRAGILIYFQSSALSEAYNYMGEGDENVLDITIENQPAREWINNKAVESMQKFVAVENKFDQLGIKFENKEDELAVINAEQWWEYIGEYYEEIGVSKQSYLDVGVNSEKRRALFDYYYGKGGEKEVSDEEISAYLKDNYARIKYIEMPLKDGEGNILKSDEKADIKKMAEEYIERAKNGESFEKIAKEYKDYYAALSAAEGSVSENDTAAAGDETEAEEVNYGTVITKDSLIPSASVVEKVFSGEIAEGEYTIIEEFEVYYIVYRTDLFADPDYFGNIEGSVRHTLKDDEFNGIIDGWIKEQNVVVNVDSLDRYKLDKLTA